MKYIVLIDTDTGDHFHHDHIEFDTRPEAVSYANKIALECKVWVLDIEIVEATTIGTFHRCGIQDKEKTALFE